MNRLEFQALSNERLEEADILLASGKPSGAYYMAGYSVEMALKSCILLHIEKTGIIFEDRKYASECFTHDFNTLLDKANLKTEYNILRNSQDPDEVQLAANWLVVTKWNESSRYQTHLQSEAKAMIDAISHHETGVLTWLKKYW